MSYKNNDINLNEAVKTKENTNENNLKNDTNIEMIQQNDNFDVDSSAYEEFGKESQEKLSQKLIQADQKKSVNWNIITAFNGLRGLFVSMVLLYHMNTTLFFIGEQGVDGFLVMSGWLNALSFDKFLKKINFLNAIKNFFIRRAFRILPVYYLLLVMIFLFMGKENKDQCSKDILKMIFLYQNFYNYGQNCWGVTWSLALEVQLYLTVPFVILSFFVSKKLGYMVSTMTLIILAVFAILNSQKWQWDIDGFQFQRSINFFLGITFYFVARSFTKVSQQVAKFCIAFSLISFLLLQTILYIILIIKGTDSLHFIRSINYSIFALLVGLFVFGCQNYQTGQANQIMQNSILLFMNKISYSLYLFHLFIKSFVDQHFEGFTNKLQGSAFVPFFYIICYIPMIVFCHYLFEYFEKPMIKLSHKITS